MLASKLKEKSERGRHPLPLTKLFIETHILAKHGADAELTNPWLLSTVRNYHSTKIWARYAPGESPQYRRKSTATSPSPSISVTMDATPVAMETELDTMEETSLRNVDDLATVWRQQYADRKFSSMPKIKIEDEHRTVVNSYTSSESATGSTVGQCSYSRTRG